MTEFSTILSLCYGAGLRISGALYLQVSDIGPATRTNDKCDTESGPIPMRLHFASAAPQCIIPREPREHRCSVGRIIVLQFE